MLHAQHRVAAIRRARIPIVSGWSRACHTGTIAIASLSAIAQVGVRAAGSGRNSHMLHAQHRIAAVRRARVPVVSVHRCACHTGTATVAGLFTIAQVGVRAAHAGRNSHVLHAQRRIATIRRARIPIIGVHDGSICAESRWVANLVAVAEITISAARAGLDGQVLDTQNRITAVRGARVPVIDDRRRSGKAVSRTVAGLIAVAEIEIRATGPRCHEQVHNANGRIATIRRTRIPIVDVHRCARHADPTAVAGLSTVAKVGVRAAHAGRDSHMLHAQHRIAAVRRARIPIIGVHDRSICAESRWVANLVAVAEITISAARAGLDGQVLDTQNRITAVRGARVPVIDDRRRSGKAVSRTVAGLIAVAEIEIRATGPRCHEQVHNANGRIATVRRARVPVVSVHRCACHAGTIAIASLSAIAQVGVRAAGSGHNWGVLAHPGHATVYRAGVVVRAVRRHTGHIGETVLEHHPRVQIHQHILREERPGGHCSLAEPEGSVRCQNERLHGRVVADRRSLRPCGECPVGAVLAGQLDAQRLRTQVGSCRWPKVGAICHEESVGKAKLAWSKHL